MSQFENKMDDFVPFGDQVRTEYQEDDRAVPDAVIDACFDALGEIMFPIDDRGERPLECQTYFAVQRTFGAEGKRDYFLLSHVDQIDAGTPFSRDGADWGECDGELACKVYSEPPTLLTFRELSPAALDTLRDEDGYLFDVPSEAVEKVFSDPLCTMPSTLALTEVELKVEDAIFEVEMERDTGESLDELAAAKTEESSLDAGEECGERTDQSR